MGELTLQARLRIRNLTLSAGWMGLRENNEEGRTAGMGTMQGKERRQFPEEDPLVEEGQGQGAKEIPRRKAAEGTHMKELTLGGLWSCDIKLEA